VRPSRFWLSYAEPTAIMIFLSFGGFGLCVLLWVRVGGQAGGSREARKSGRVGCGRSIEAPGSAPNRAFGSRLVGGGEGGRAGSPTKLPGESVGKGIRAPPGSIRESSIKLHLPCNAIRQGGVTWTARLLSGERFAVHIVMLCYLVKFMLRS